MMQAPALQRLVSCSSFRGPVTGRVPVAAAHGLGVLIDAFVVRMTLVPAVMALLGERAWYLPRWLDRLLPDVDLEGTKLRQHTSEGWTKDPDPDRARRRMRAVLHPSWPDLSRRCP